MPAKRRSPEQLAEGPLYDFLLGPLQRGYNENVGQGICEENRRQCEFMDNLEEFNLLVTVRSSCKTTITSGKILQEWAKDRNYCVALGSDEVSHPGATVNELIQQCSGRSGSPYATLYGDLVNSRYTMLDGFATSKQDAYLMLRGITRPLREMSADVFSRKRSRTGYHYNLVLWDDPHIFDNTRNAEQIRATVEAIKASLPLTTNYGKFLVVMTIWDKNDFACQVLTKRVAADLKWNTLILPAYERSRDGSWNKKILNFPKNVPQKKLDEQLAFMGPVQFANQFLLEPTSEMSQIFDVDKHYMTYSSLPHGMNYYMTCDFADGIEGRDPSAYIVWGHDKETNVCYEVENFCEVEPVHEFSNRICAAGMRWNVIRIGIEKERFHVFVETNLREVCRQSDYFPELSPLIHGSKKKEIRAQAVSGRFSMHQFRFDAANSRLKQNLRDCPVGSDDHLLDCFIYCPQVVPFTARMPSGASLMSVREMTWLEKAQFRNTRVGAGEPAHAKWSARRVVSPGDEFGGRFWQSNMQRRMVPRVQLKMFERKKTVDGGK